MHLERIRPSVLRVTLHAHELAALVAAARWAVAGTPGELGAAQREQLAAVLRSYELELERMNRSTS